MRVSSLLPIPCWRCIVPVLWELLVPLCVSCAGAHAEFVCSECELRELFRHFLEAAHGITTCPSARRRRLAQLTQMMVSAELEERVRCEGSPTLLATLSEIQLCLMA